jgi:hypothetical protein
MIPVPVHTDDICTTYRTALFQAMRRFPREYVAKLTHLEMRATRAAFARRPREPLEEGDLVT